MTRKDFKLIASIIRTFGDRECVAVTFADRLNKEFPNFDPTKFVSACLEG